MKAESDPNTVAPVVPKADRQRLILEIIARTVVETQEQLADSLRMEGVPVTQATVSRDIRELRLTKGPAGDGEYRYVIPQDRSVGDTVKRAKRMFRDFVTDTVDSGNLIVVKTLPGAAQGVAAALDGLELSEVIGTIAGDDTILLVVKPVEAVDEVMARLKRLRA